MLDVRKDLEEAQKKVIQQRTDIEQGRNFRIGEGALKTLKFFIKRNKGKIPDEDISQMESVLSEYEAKLKSGINTDLSNAFNKGSSWS